MGGGPVCRAATWQRPSGQRREVQWDYICNYASAAYCRPDSRSCSLFHYCRPGWSEAEIRGPGATG